MKMEVIVKRTIKYGVYAITLGLAVIIAFFGFNSQKNMGNSLSDNEVLDFFTEEAYGHPVYSGDDGDDGDDG